MVGSAIDLTGLATYIRCDVERSIQWHIKSTVQYYFNFLQIICQLITVIV